MHVRRANVGSCEQAVMSFESQAVSALVTKHFVAIFLIRALHYAVSTKIMCACNCYHYLFI